MSTIETNNGDLIRVCDVCRLRDDAGMDFYSQKGKYLCQDCADVEDEEVAKLL